MLKHSEDYTSTELKIEVNENNAHSGSEHH